MSKLTVSNFVHSFIAVLAGNAAYFIVMPYLPLAARHMPERLDLGVAVDFWFCLFFLGLIKTVVRLKRNSEPQKR
ncbi:MAG: hypothetical protein ABJA69_04335 [Acidobacteriaceae bacterium]